MHPEFPPLYDPAFDHAACGLGFIARIDGRASHEIVEQGLEVLRNLAHRGARGSDAETGDGAGILLQLPDAFLRSACRIDGIELPPNGGYAVGAVFLSADRDERVRCERELERIASEEGQPVLGWRDVPVRPEVIGVVARSVAPTIRQVFLERRLKGDDAAFERKLYVIRRRLHRVIEERYRGAQSCYVASLSGRTLVYKGLLHGTQVSSFYPDLTHPAMASTLALVHSRFSTNTLGSWQLAHPYRYVAHNGEINTLRGNVNWMRARESQLQSDLFGHDMERLRPIVEPRVSDSAAFDNALELLVLSGRSLPHAVMMMIPEAWENNDLMDPDRRAFYQYHSEMMEPWDGPAAMVFTDGRLVGATLDRNGLRPARYSVTRDGLVALASEEGALPLPPETVVRRWRLQPGRMLVVDTEQGRIREDDEIKRTVAAHRPYARWVEQSGIRLGCEPNATDVQPDASLLQQQRAFGYTFEDEKVVLTPMAAQGKEPDSSMGTDTPLAVLSERPQLLFSYFHQLFAQVTNPPIDPLREEMVMSLAMSLGPEPNLFDENLEQGYRVLLDHPILQAADIAKLRHGTPLSPETATLSTLFPVDQGPEGLEIALNDLCRQAEELAEGNTSILILSDRGVDQSYAPIPSLLAVSAIHHRLVERGTRTRVGLVIETGEAREVHHCALLIGYGASAIHPYLALQTVEDMAISGKISCTPAAAVEHYIKAIRRGLLKIISKMGISVLPSYCGAQLFEAIGLDRDLVDRHFSGTASRLGGLGFEDLGHETLERHMSAFSGSTSGVTSLDIGGEYQVRQGGEYHQWNPESIVALQRAVRTGQFDTFEAFTEHFDGQNARLATLRGLFELKEAEEIPLSQVEPPSEIVKRFSTGAMSFGSLSREAHETLAVAMNRIGGKSNTGEGGEEGERFAPDPNGDSRRSAIKQVASGRFGVTAHYLVNGDILQIKMAQGSKPGEGGQIPGHKVSEDIARVRHSTPGVALISPPPHHDIYSIEDLAQLIYDLKTVSPAAAISVKLVSEVGVGTIAAGVAKAKADHITISGCDGGTGASPLSSIKYAGLPWELGLAETQQVLVANHLRSRVRLQVDGHLKTGRDVVIGALLGAEEFSFSTAPLVATGCIMMRACHLNTCPVGIATQDPELRERFAGTPEHVINYFFFLAEQVRRLMARMGFRRFEDMVGRSERIQARRTNLHWKARTLDVSAILAPLDGAVLHHTEDQDHGLGERADNRLMDLCQEALIEKRPISLGDQTQPLPIGNQDRAVGSMISGEIARRHGARGLPDDTLSLTFRGTAGQSFGAWGARGLTLTLYGEANDYLAKGLSGGKIVVTPPANAAYEPESSIVVGNVALYGATAGEVYIRGTAGERFAVRNSGATAVVEGVGDHGCEYMTGGAVLVLGPTGRNFAAGMSGGIAVVLDWWNRLPQMCNQEMVDLEPLVEREDVALVRRLLRRHLELTGSRTAASILQGWPEFASKFVKVMPHDLQRAESQPPPVAMKAV